MRRIMSKKQKPAQQQQDRKSNMKDVVVNEKSLKIALLIVFCVPALLYLQSVSFGFVGFDDDMILVNSSAFFSHASNIAHAFSTDALTTRQSVFYRPLQTISYLVDAQISGVAKTWMYHLSNVLLIGLIACVLFLLLKQLKVSQKLAMTGSILYCVHPLFVSTIAWIPARGDLQLTLFSLLALVLFIEYQQTGKLKFLILHFLSFTIALFCKETAAMLPVLFAGYILCFTDKKLFDKKHLVFYTIYGILGVQWFWMRSRAIVDIAHQEDTVGLKALSSMIKTVPESLAKFFVPIDIAPIPSFSMVKTTLGIVLIAAIVIVLFASKTRKPKEKLFFTGWFLLFIVPTLFFKHTMIDYLDHRFMLPLIGILLFSVTALPQKWVDELEHKKSWILIAVICCLAFNTFIKAKAYASQTTFYNEALAKNTHSSFIYYNRACMKINGMQPQDQIAEYSKAIALKPDYFLFYLNRGSAYTDAGMLNKALVDFSKCIELNPVYADGYYNRGYTYRQMQMNERALEDYSKAIELRPTFYSAVLNRANTYSFFKQYDKAIADYGKAMELHPDSLDPYYFRGIIYEQMNEPDKAIADYTTAISVSPSNAEIYFNRGNLYNKKGMPDKALDDYSKAISINPNHGNALNNRAITLYNKGMKDQACDDFAKAERLGIKAAQDNRMKLCK